VARALRASFFGDEAIREQRGRHELKVMVRLPEKQRTSELDLERLMVATPSGGFVPLSSVADFSRGQSPTEITREDGRRTVEVTADLGPGVKSSREVLERLKKANLSELTRRFGGLSWAYVGEQRERSESLGSLGSMFLLALVVMYALLAIPFRSYAQPLIMMAVIPFGVIGSVLGHVIMGYEISIISVMGIIAVAGIVVNDSLVLVDAVNRLRARGIGLVQAVLAGAASRVRPILLTSLTTFFGLAPMVLETSPQARFLIPMALSLSFGALFVTVVVLVLVPPLYIIVERMKLNRVARAEVLNPEARQAVLREEVGLG
jgi:multidrug efflux pump subunit AcrB